VGASVLDVACGYGRWCGLIRSNYWEAGLDSPPAVDGFDAFGPNVELCREHGCYRRVWQQTLPDEIDGTWDTVLASEFIEHVRPDDVATVVAQLEACARRRIIFSTPNWEYMRGGEETKVGFNAFEAHHSYVPRSFFRERGYRIIGAGFGNPKKLIVKVGHRLGLAPHLHSLTRAIPPLAELTIAVKDV
jgi:2-polyprenyl-3-methyl-5-hydroxy-6-metoxy-1,4-benzoquinol methylase